MSGSTKPATMAQFLAPLMDGMPEDLAADLLILGDGIGDVEKLILHQAKVNDRIERAIAGLGTILQRVEKALKDVKTSEAKEPAKDTATAESIARIEAAMKKMQDTKKAMKPAAPMELEFIPHYDAAGKLRKLVAKEK